MGLTEMTGEGLVVVVEAISNGRDRFAFTWRDRVLAETDCG